MALRRSSSLTGTEAQPDSRSWPRVAGAGWGPGAWRRGHGRQPIAGLGEACRRSPTLRPCASAGSSPVVRAARCGRHDRGGRRPARRRAGGGDQVIESPATRRTVDHPRGRPRPTATGDAVAAAGRRAGRTSPAPSPRCTSTAPCSSRGRCPPRSRSCPSGASATAARSPGARSAASDSAIVWDGGRPFVLSSGPGPGARPGDGGPRPEGLRLALGDGVHGLVPGDLPAQHPGGRRRRRRRVVAATPSRSRPAPDALVRGQRRHRPRARPHGPAPPRRPGPRAPRGRPRRSPDSTGAQRRDRSSTSATAPFDLVFTPAPDGGWTVAATTDARRPRRRRPVASAAHGADAGPGERRSPTRTCAARWQDDDFDAERLGGRRGARATGARTPAFADTDGPLLYRRSFDAMGPPEGRRAWLTLRRPLLPGRRVARRRLPRRHRGLLRAPHLRGHRRRCARAGEHHLAVEVTCARPARPHGQAQHHRRVPALGLPRPRLEPGRHLARRSRVTETGPVRIASLRVLCREATAERAVRRAAGHARQRRRRAPCACTRTLGRPRPPARPAARRRRQRGRVDAHRRPARAVVAACARRADAARPAVQVRARRGRGRRRVRRAPPPHRAAPGAHAVVDRVGQRRAALPQGLQPGPDPHGAGRGDARGAGAATSPSPSTPASTCSGCTPTSPVPSSTTRPTSRACSSGRTSRCSGATPAASASRRCARPGPPSTCSATTRRSRSGAATTSRWPSRTTRTMWGDPKALRRMAVKALGRAGAADVEQDGARPLGEAGLRARRRHPPGHRPLRRAPPPAAARRHRHATSTSAGTTATSATCPAFLRAVPRMGRFVTEFGAQAVPDDAAFCEPERWPDLDWERLGHTHALQKPLFDQLRAAGGPRHLRRRGATPRRRTRPMVVRRHIEALRRIKYQPTGGFAQFCFADGHPAVTWSVLGHDRAPEAGLRRAPGRLPAGDRRRRPPARRRCAPGDALDARRARGQRPARRRSSAPR